MQVTLCINFLNETFKYFGINLIYTTVICNKDVIKMGTFDNVTTMITDVVDIFPSLLDLVIAVMPIMVAMALITFILGIIAGVLNMMKGRFND